MRVAITKGHQLQVWYRDAWSCRYCGDAVFFVPTLKILESQNPGHGYYHPHWKREAMIQQFSDKGASVDHVIPVVHGGKNGVKNYVTACWLCNTTLNDRLEGRQVPGSVNETNKLVGWDGLAGLYPKLGPDDIWNRLLVKYVKSSRPGLRAIRDGVEPTREKPSTASDVQISRVANPRVCSALPGPLTGVPDVYTMCSRKMKTSIATFGNSKGVRIPKPLLEESGLGKQVEITAKKGEIRIRPAREETAVTAEALLSERSLGDWKRPAEDKAWASLQ